MDCDLTHPRFSHVVAGVTPFIKLQHNGTLLGIVGQLEFVFGKASVKLGNISKDDSGSGAGSDADVSCDADAPCVICNHTEDDADMLMCDACNNGFHLSCLGRTGVPKGKWRCATCIDANRPVMVSPTRADTTPVRATGPPPGTHQQNGKRTTGQGKQPAAKRGTAAAAHHDSDGSDDDEPTLAEVEQGFLQVISSPDAQKRLADRLAEIKDLNFLTVPDNLSAPPPCDVTLSGEEEPLQVYGYAPRHRDDTDRGRLQAGIDDGFDFDADDGAIEFLGIGKSKRLVALLSELGSVSPSQFNHPPEEYRALLHLAAQVFGLDPKEVVDLILGIGGQSAPQAIHYRMTTTFPQRYLTLEKETTGPGYLSKVMDMVRDIVENNTLYTGYASGLTLASVGDKHADTFMDGEKFIVFIQRLQNGSVRRFHCNADPDALRKDMSLAAFSEWLSAAGFLQDVQFIILTGE
jgi:hypothetical protein